MRTRCAISWACERNSCVRPGRPTIDARPTWAPIRSSVIIQLYQDKKGQTVTAGHNVDPARWQEAFENLMGRVAGRFARVEPRYRMRKLVLGLLSDLPRKNCWVRHEAPCDRVEV
jgi:hypothetical protein